MTDPQMPFLGSAALAAGTLTRYELRRHHVAVLPNVYLPARIRPNLLQRTVAAWLWSGGQAVVAGAAAAALPGAKWVDATVPIELISPNTRPPAGVLTRNDLLLPGEQQLRRGMAVTTVARTAFDLGRRGSLGQAVARLDALANATRFHTAEVLDLARRHRHARGLRQLEGALDLVDAGAQSPKETRLRLLLINGGFPRPTTQIPVPGPDGRWKYFLDMGWQDLMLAVEYDGEHHLTDRQQYVWDATRLEYLRQLGWTHIKVLKEHRGDDVLRRVRAAWNALMLH
ncbi:endonuclease domain-containing protein [Mycobacterium sp. pW045]|uniref:endonuclease domain-containing protein n=1 Tax=Mycobacterium sp. pW045 TaxID=3238984 RepID=UPI00351ADD8D